MSDGYKEKRKAKISHVNSNELYRLKCGARNGTWTRDPDLGKVVLYHWAILALGTRGETWTPTSLRYQILNLARLPIPPLSHLFLSLERMARLVGFEPTTFGFEVHCSIQLSYKRKSFNMYSGANDEARTRDHRSHNPELYQTELHPPPYSIWYAREDSNLWPTD